MKDKLLQTKLLGSVRYKVQLRTFNINSPHNHVIYYSTQTRVNY